MVPLGYYTAQEADIIIWQCTYDKSEKRGDSVKSMVLDSSLQLFVERDGRIYRVPFEDLDTLLEELDFAFRCGWFPKDMGDRYERRVEEPDETSEGERYRAVWSAVLREYEGLRLLIRESDIEALFPRAALSEPLERSGVAGRPTPIRLVLTEHERRREEGRTASSRQEEGRQLKVWLDESYPNAPNLKAKSIADRLPKSLQPHSSPKITDAAHISGPPHSPR